MSIGKGIAIAGIWIGVGICSFNAGTFIVPIAACAIIATIAVAAAQ